MRTILVTGGAGFIGSHIVDALVKRGDKVKVIDNLCTGVMNNIKDVIEDVEFIEADVNNTAALQMAFKGVDCVIHHAALASVQLSVEDPLKVNKACVDGTLNVLNEARLAGVRRVVYAGSSSCYGDQPFAANREADCPSTNSPYAVGKLAGEYYCHAFFQSYGLETVCVRYFNIFGPRQDPNSHYSAVIPLFITWMLSGKRPTVFGDGHQSRDFCYVSNVVDANLLAIDAPKEACGRSFNIAAGRSVSLLELISELQECLGVDIEPEFLPPRQGDIRDSMSDISQANRVLGYVPNVDFSEGLKRSIEYYRTVVKQPV